VAARCSSFVAGEPTLEEMTLTRPVAKSFLTAGALVLGLIASGCGDESKDNGTSDVKAVAKVMSSLDTASRAGDGELICSQLFTPKLAKSVSTSSSSGECAAEVKSKLFSPDTEISVQDIEVPDDLNATATVKETNGNTSRIFLVKQSGQWRIRGVAPA
jgi:hypothetical protein